MPAETHFKRVLSRRDLIPYRLVILTRTAPYLLYGIVQQASHGHAAWGALPGGSGWTDHEDRLTAEWLQRNGILVDVHTAGQAAQTVAKDRSFHPLRSYLASLRWDGVERLNCWLSAYLGVEDTMYARAVGARWLISAVARIYRPVCGFRGM